MSNMCLCATQAGPDIILHPSCFGQVWLFEGAPPEAWNAVSRHLVRRSLATGEDLFRQGDRADSMYLIKKGSVKLWKLSEEGRLFTLDIRKAGDLLGENVLLDEDEFPVGATCLEPTLTCGIDRETFEKLMVEYPAAGLVVIRNLSRRIQYLSGRLGAFSEPNLDDRLYAVLVNVAQEVGTCVPGGWTIAFPLTHEEIGFLVGAHRVSVTRALGKLRDTGKIVTEGKALFIRAR
jgi:CRP/FNR family cyclic AMP-dependent transcriptional regulator